MPKRVLDSREVAFAHNYVGKKTNIQQAAIDAGYTEKTAKKYAYGWLGMARSGRPKPHLIEYIRQLIFEREQEFKRDCYLAIQILSDAALTGRIKVGNEEKDLSPTARLAYIKEFLDRVRGDHPDSLYGYKPDDQDIDQEAEVIDVSLSQDEKKNLAHLLAKTVKR